MQIRKVGRELSMMASLAAVFIACCVHAEPGDEVDRGHDFYENRCEGCHSVKEDRVGPRHRGIVGRPVAAIPNFNYSPALRALGGVWTTSRLDQWLQDPQAMAPGSDMSTSVPEPDERRAIIAYLVSVSPPPE